jgi:hypothetical protein
MRERILSVPVHWFLLVAAWLVLSGVAFTCDHLKPSSSLGGCRSDVTTCESIPTQTQCDWDQVTWDAYAEVEPGVFDDDRYAYEIKQDFPTHCPSTPGWNCNQPSRPCYRKTLCEFVNGNCVTKPGSTTPWKVSPKREGSQCSS